VSETSGVDCVCFSDNSKAVRHRQYSDKSSAHTESQWCGNEVS